MNHTSLTFTHCPECGEIAEVGDRFVLASTDGPVEHIRMVCVRRHLLCLPVATLDRDMAPAAASLPHAAPESPCAERVAPHPGAGPE